KELRRLSGARYVAMRPSRPLLFACAAEKGAIHIRDETGKEVRRLDPRADDPLSQLVYSGDGSTLASIHSVYVHRQLRPLINLWHVDTGLFLRQIEAKDSNERACVVLSGDGGSLALGGYSSRIHLHDVKTGRLRCVIRAEGSVYHLAITPDGKTLA